MSKRILTIAAIAATYFLANGMPASAHNSRVPLDGGLLKIDTRKDPAKHKFLFKTTRQNSIFPTHNPRLVGSQILIRWAGADEGRTAVIALDPMKWTALGNPAGSRGYKYVDREMTTGVKLVLWKPGPRGGTLKIRGGGANFPYELPGDLDSVEVYFGVENEWYGAVFGGEVKKSEEGHYLAKNAPAPPSLDDAICGNGMQELGEDCDDGNLVDGDTCTNSCETGDDCPTGTTYDNTYDGIQEVLFKGYGCTTCHGASGGLNLAAGASFANLVGVASQADPAMKRVAAGDQNASMLYRKLAAKTIGGEYATGLPQSPMPVGPATVTEDHLSALYLWIRGGASETATVAGAAELLGGCFPPDTPLKAQPLDPPADSVGVQFYAPGWELPSQSEHEVCYTTYYDLEAQGLTVPESAKGPCPSTMGGASETCFKYGANYLVQDPQSHHSIETVYTGAYSWTHSSWGGWKCLGGPLDGASCNPTQFGVSAASGGAECGERSACASAVRNSVACNGYGPPDYSFNLGGSGSPTTQRFGGSQESVSSVVMPDGVYSSLPMRGYIVWNSHAFNLTNEDTTLEQWYNFIFAEADDNIPMSGIFDADAIFGMNVPQFQKQEICDTFVMPQNSSLFELSSHAHQHLERFRIWLPPNNSSSSAPSSTPDYISAVYNDPDTMHFSPARYFASGLSNNQRRIKFCAEYDNGADDPNEVRRYSESVGLVVLNPCTASQRQCFGGPKQGTNCYGNDATCDSSPGAGDGVCDACPLRGGVTTFDEMMILLGNYFPGPPVPSTSQAFLDTPSTLLR